MADDTPDTPASPPKPAPRRRAPRQTPVKDESTAKAEAPSAADDSKPAPPKRVRKPAASRAPASPATSPAKPAPKPRSSKRATPRRAARPKEAAPPAVAAETVRDNWAKAAVAGGLAAVGALATAALLSLRGSSQIAPAQAKQVEDEESTA